MIKRTRGLTVEQRFWNKIEKSDGCWLWTASRFPSGYGQLSVRGDDGFTKICAHRLSWTIHFGPIPDNQWVLHRCDTPPCVRPDHLFLGDHLANVADKVAKGRQSRVGPPRKLSDETVEAIRRDRADGLRLQDLADRYEISLGYASQLVNYVYR